VVRLVRILPEPNTIIMQIIRKSKFDFKTFLWGTNKCLQTAEQIYNLQLLVVCGFMGCQQASTILFPCIFAQGYWPNLLEWIMFF
jgi:hypothetical protein